MLLQDPFDRTIKYLRLSVTDRCNLRCFYCMPGEHVSFKPRTHLLTYEELLQLTSIFTDMGIDKVRITGGEPFFRKDLIKLLEKLSDNPRLKKISITTNGILTKPYIPQLKSLGIHDINLSLDTLNEKRFKEITLRDDFFKVTDTLQSLIDEGFNIKINVVVIEGMNDDEIIPLAQLASKHPVSVRFIEEMPFNGREGSIKKIRWHADRIHQRLATGLDDFNEIPSAPNATAKEYTFSGAQGNVGIIAAYSRTFCGSCDRIRITSSGQMRTCLYGHDTLDLKHLLRTGVSKEDIQSAIGDAVGHRAKDGFEAEQTRRKFQSTHDSMSIIGG